MFFAFSSGATLPMSRGPQDHDLDLLFLGEGDGVVDDARRERADTASGDLAFEHRDHRFQLEVGLEAGRLGRALPSGTGAPLEELVDLGDLLLVRALGGREAAVAPASPNISENRQSGVRRRRVRRVRRGVGKIRCMAARAVDLHVFPGPAIGVDQRRLCRR